MFYLRTASLLVFSTVAAFGGTILFPTGSLSIDALNPSGTSFVFTGTLTGADTIDFTQTGNPCLQSGSTYCVNGAGVITVAGTLGVGQSSPEPIVPSFTYGALLMEISGVPTTVQVFATDAGNGLGSGSPPASLTLPTTSLSALGFGSFSVANPTITFVVADTLFTDNSAGFVLSQTPEPASLLLFGSALIGLSLFSRRRFVRK